MYVGNILLNYAEKAKDITSSQTFNEFIINEEEILDFLTFWLRQEVENSLFVLYDIRRYQIIGFVESDYIVPKIDNLSVDSK